MPNATLFVPSLEMYKSECWFWSILKLSWSSPSTFLMIKGDVLFSIAVRITSLDLIVPLALILPSTWSFSVGEVVPIPTLPSPFIVSLSRSAVFKFIALPSLL